mmetsp:Transcript_11321/g.16869  ORF Transcript_11321/g.16869 Transcript_11321/m.16869 type:complete len:334 (-) Transcript_11321:335-1336(-)
MPHQRERNAIQSDLRICKTNCVRFAVRVAYDGLDYHGFQSQPHGNTIQDQIEHRLSNLLNRKVRILGCSRTDAKVHARGFVFTVDLSGEEIERLSSRRINECRMKLQEQEGCTREALVAKTIHSAIKQLTPQRPGSIVARTVVPITMDFDPKFSSLWKRYSYHVACCDNHSSPFLTRYCWQMTNQQLDFDAMSHAVRIMNGKHNFEWISLVEKGEQRDPFRDLKLSIVKMEDHKQSLFDPCFANTTMYKITGTCDFFLYKMMRRIVGIIVAVGKGEVKWPILESCLETQDNECCRMNGSDDVSSAADSIPSALLQTAPPHGLCLEHVEYEIPI